MSTRGVVLLSRQKHRHPYNTHEIWYRHMDTYPMGLGVELLNDLANYLKSDPDDFELDIEEIIVHNTQEKYPHCVDNPADAFHKVQGDLEWIYCIELDPQKLEYSEFHIYKVVRMWNSTVCDDFVYDCYSKWFKDLPKSESEILADMEKLDEQSTVMQAGFRAFGAAIERKPMADLERKGWQLEREHDRLNEVIDNTDDEDEANLAFESLKNVKVKLVSVHQEKNAIQAKMEKAKGVAW
jgi:hypothetical protein